MLFVIKLSSILSLLSSILPILSSILSVLSSIVPYLSSIDFWYSTPNQKVFRQLCCFCPQFWPICHRLNFVPICCKICLFRVRAKSRDLQLLTIELIPLTEVDEWTRIHNAATTSTKPSHLQNMWLYHKTKSELRETLHFYTRSASSHSKFG